MKRLILLITVIANIGTLTASEEEEEREEKLVCDRDIDRPNLYDKIKHPRRYRRLIRKTRCRGPCHQR